VKGETSDVRREKGMENGERRKGGREDGGMEDVITYKKKWVPGVWYPLLFILFKREIHYNWL
jgi:hypothetical protein